MGLKHEVLKEGQTKAWDHLQMIELEKLSTKLVSKVSEVKRMISFDHFYTFYRTLKRWTTGTLVNLGFEMSFGYLYLRCLCGSGAGLLKDNSPDPPAC